MLWLKSLLIHTGLQPGVRREGVSRKTVSTVFADFANETVKTVSQLCECFYTGLKPGVNEKNF